MLKICSIKVLKLLVLITASFFVSAPRVALAQSPETTTVFIVRHAEKASSTERDPSLNPAGRARAEQLIHVLAEAEIEAIYSTPTKRTQETAEPLLSFLKRQMPQLNIKPYSSSNEVAEKVKREHTGQRLLIVSHSGAQGLAAIINELNGDPNACPIRDDYDYDNLCLVILDSSDDTEVINLHYGAPSSGFANLEI